MSKFNHGNRLRSEKEAYEVKKARSRRVYAEKNLLIDHYWLNEKVIRKYYALNGPKKYVDPLLLENEGLNFDLTKSTLKVNGITYQMMHKYGYSLQPNQKLLLWKI